MSDLLGQIILIIVSIFTILGFHWVRKAYVSTCIYSSIVSGVLCAITWVVMVKIKGSYISHFYIQSWMRGFY